MLQQIKKEIVQKEDRCYSFVIIYYYMAGVCSRYNARSDLLSAASRQGIILP